MANGGNSESGERGTGLMRREKGKRLPSTMEYAHSLMPIEFPVDESWINRYGLVSELGIPSSTVKRVSH